MTRHGWYVWHTDVRDELRQYEEQPEPREPQPEPPWCETCDRYFTVDCPACGEPNA